MMTIFTRVRDGLRPAEAAPGGGGRIPRVSGLLRRQTSPAKLGILESEAGGVGDGNWLGSNIRRSWSCTIEETVTSTEDWIKVAGIRIVPFRCSVHNGHLAISLPDFPDVPKES